MSNFTGIIVVIVSIVCMMMAQRKTISLANQRLYSLLGSIAAIMVAAEAAQRNAWGVSVFFAAGAAVSLATIVLSYLKTTKTDI